MVDSSFPGCYINAKISGFPPNSDFGGNKAKGFIFSTRGKLVSNVCSGISKKQCYEFNERILNLSRNAGVFAHRVQHSSTVYRMEKSPTYLKFCRNIFLFIFLQSLS